MADDTTVSDDANIPDVSLTNTDIAPKADDATGDAADKGKDNAAAPSDAPKPDEAKPDAKDTEAKDPSGKDEPAEGDKPAEGDQKPVDQAPDDKKPDPNKAAQEYQSRQRTRQQIAQQLDQHYGPKTAEQLVEEGLTPEQAAIQALNQKVEFGEQRAQVIELNSNLRNDALEIQNKFPIFRPFNEDGTKNPDYDPEFTQMVDEQYLVAARVQTDPETGIVLNAEVPVYDFYQKMAGIYSRGASKGTQQGQREMQEMISRTEDAVGGSPSTTNGGDDLAAMEERLGDVVIT